MVVIVVMVMAMAIVKGGGNSGGDGENRDTNAFFFVSVGDVSSVWPAGHIPQRRPGGPCVVVSVDFQSIASICSS